MGCTSSMTASDVSPSIHECYSFGEKLGQGHFGQVRACTQRKSSLQNAVKIVDIHGSRGKKAEAHNEGMLWKRLGCHTHVVKLLETYMDEEFGYFVMERCDHSLLDMLSNKAERLQEVDLFSTFREMLLGIQHCHNMGVVHRDIKAANFLVDFSGRVQLCDFGLAELEDEGLEGIAGTAPFMSPEMVQDRVYNHKTDIWSMGATAYLMLYGQYPYMINRDKSKRKSASQQMQEAIANNKKPPTYKVDTGLTQPSALASGFVKALLRREPQLRPSSSECLQLPALRLQDRELRRGAGTTETSLAPAVRLAKQRTGEFKSTVDPTVAKTRDELIEQLQAKFGQKAWGRSFSEPFHGEKSLGCSSRFSRSSSHGGELSSALGRLDMDDCSSTTASSAVVSIRLSL